jgi:hypothetical protein
LGANPKEAFFVLSVVVLFARIGRIVRICTGRTTPKFGMKIKAREGMIFEAAFVELSKGGRLSYRRKGTTIMFWAHFSRCHFQQISHSCMDSGTGFKAVLWWDNFVL